MCTDGTACKRRVCFFAHTDSELRKPEEDPAWLQVWSWVQFCLSLQALNARLLGLAQRLTTAPTDILSLFLSLQLLYQQQELQRGLAEGGCSLSQPVAEEVLSHATAHELLDLGPALLSVCHVWPPCVLMA